MFEIVERKGNGHPDTICDTIANLCAKNLHNAYLEGTGMLHHYNMDKALLSAGKVTPELAYVVKHDIPMTMYIGDRATLLPEVDVGDIVEKTVRAWFTENIMLYTDDKLKVDCVAQRGSRSLTTLVEGKNRTANDTSATVGYAPFTDMESAANAFEWFLAVYRKKNPEIGMDTKIMLVRDAYDNVSATIAVAMVAKHIYSPDDYFENIVKFKDAARNFLTRNLEHDLLSVYINPSDTPDNLYVTNLGLSAEAGDSGQVGRGNNVAGFIPVTRPVSAEADAGKNAHSHIGKIYNRAGFEISRRIYEELSLPTYTWLVSRIGDPITEPHMMKINIDCIHSEIDVDNCFDIGVEVLDNLDSIYMF